jgi:hypothetical protein
METFPKIILVLQGAVFLAVFVIVVILSIRRYQIRKKEDFEKRDN